MGMAFQPQGRSLFAVGSQDRAYVVPLDGSPARRLDGFDDDTFLFAAAVSPSGRRVATAPGYGGGERTLRVWDLDTGDLHRFDLPANESTAPGGEPSSGQTGYERGVLGLAFVGESTLYSGGDGGIRRWNLEEGTHELVLAERPGYAADVRFDAEGRTALTRRISLSNQKECHPAELVDLRTGVARALPAFGRCTGDEGIALDASGGVAAVGGVDGVVRVGRVSGGEPHLLLGHEAAVQYVAISPDLRWVASTGEDNTLRLWPMPDLDEPPLHTLPHEELLAKLRSLTNLRAVRDPEAPNGWRIDLDPFPGWKDVPEW
jgi:WD40 repeat protein